MWPALQKLAKGLGDGMQGTAAMVDLIKVAAHLQPADRYFDDAAVADFMLDRNARQDSDAETRHQRFLDRFGAAELHGDVQKPLGRLPVFRQQLAQGVQGARAALPRD